MPRSELRTAALRAMKAGAAMADRVRRPRSGVVVLLYHRVGGGSRSEIDLDPGVFRAQLAEIAPRAVSLGDALALLAGSSLTTPAPVAVTFDDGTADVVDVALPMLVDAGIVATLYLATSFVEGQVEMPAGGRPVSWQALADARSTGYLEIGSHTHAHALLDRIGPEAAAADLDRATKLIEDRLGVTPVDFAYPKAIPPSPATDAIVRARFRSAALAGSRSNELGRTDPWRLSRSPVQVSDGMRWFRAKLDGGMALEDVLRRQLNRRRYARAST